ncbi:MAG: SRPBCC family protein [Candidatus Ranarchaeia archaeon]
MVTYETSIEIDAPPDVVFSVVGNILDMTEIDKGVQSVKIIGDAKEGIGLRTRWSQEFEGKTIEWEEEITEWDPPRRYSFRILTPGRHTEGTHILVPIKDGKATNLTFIETYHYPRSESSAREFMSHLVKKVKRLSETKAKKAVGPQKEG